VLKLGVGRDHIEPASRAALTVVVFLTPRAPCRADPAPIIHYAPAENLEHVDVELIDGARHEIDLAA
jgi:hypothetical protein